MNDNLKMNYISMGLSILLTLFVGVMYFLLDKAMNLPLKIGYAIVVLALIVLIVYNIVAIIKKVSSKDK